MCKVSVIVRTFDRKLLLARAIQSIIEQTYKDWEIVVVNNGGDGRQVDEVAASFKEHLGRIKTFHIPYARNMEFATNVGLKNSSGEIIALLDDDDTWDRTFLEKCVDRLRNPEVFGVVCRTMLVYESIEGHSIRIIRKTPFNPKLKSVRLYRLARCNLFTTNAFVYKRKALESVGEYREDLQVLGDWEFNIRFARKYRISVIEETLANYHKRTNPSNIPSMANTSMADHIKADRFIRTEYLKKGFRGDAPLLIGMLIYGFGWVNRAVLLLKKILKSG